MPISVSEAAKLAKYHSLRYLREPAFFLELFDGGEKRIYDPSDWRP